jgi:hypothetical protein
MDGGKEPTHPQAGGLDAAQVDMSLAEGEALNGVPTFLDLPDEVREKIEKQVLNVERLFWLRATHIKRDIVTTSLLRRAIYAEQRCNETEHMLAEMACITEGAKMRIEEMQRDYDKLAKKL